MLECYASMKRFKIQTGIKILISIQNQQKYLDFFFPFKLELKNHTSLTRMICWTPASLEGRSVMLHSLRQIGLPCHQPSNREKTQIMALLCGYYLEKNGDGVKNKAKQDRKWLILVSCMAINS